mmetsp:Transcript_9760/g.36364  ORF Transcript_9760/g.36364 Transcript_9760/m.36364 type:complete len:333 (-) Transcript_9760:1063-2061(-)
MNEETNSQHSSHDALLANELNDNDSILDDDHDSIKSPHPFELKASIQRAQSRTALSRAGSRSRSLIGTVHQSARGMRSTRTSAPEQSSTRLFETTLAVEKHKTPIHKRIINRIRYGRSYTSHDTIKKLPPKKRRYWAWKYEVLRPWEPQPPKNYYKLIHSENPWFDQPPTQLRVVAILLLVLLYSCACAFLPWLINISVLDHRLTVLKVPSWILPWWFNIFAASFTHINNGIGIWFIYLTGGFRKHLKKMIPWFLMLACQALWPDILFSWTSIILAAVVCSVGWLLSVITIVWFSSKMGYAGFVIVFYNAWVAYQCVVLYYLVYDNGMSYTF